VGWIGCLTGFFVLGCTFGSGNSLSVWLSTMGSNPLMA